MKYIINDFYTYKLNNLSTIAGGDIKKSSTIGGDVEINTGIGNGGAVNVGIGKNSTKSR